MMDFLFNYGLFFAKFLTVVLLVGLLVAFIAALKRQAGAWSWESLELEHYNEKLNDIQIHLNAQLLSADQLKAAQKEEKKQAKAKKAADKKSPPPTQPRLFVLDFNGDIAASATDNLRQEITACLQVAKPEDRFLLRLESPGGMVPGYGLAAAQLMRLRERGFHLTVAVDKVAASGGYLMACVAQEIISSPFAILGSIGVVAQMPNFHRLLQKNHIDFELHTAGNHKRTLTVFGENTDEGREKFRESLHSVHVQFQDFVLKHRPQVDIAQVATGEHWLGQEALGLKLVDTLQTSDDYLLAQKDSHQIYTVRFKRRKSWADRLGQAASVALSEGLAAAAPKVLEKFMQPSATPTHLS